MVGKIDGLTLDFQKEVPNRLDGSLFRVSCLVLSVECPEFSFRCLVPRVSCFVFRACSSVLRV